MENFNTSFELTRKFIDRRTFARRAAFAGLGVMGASFLDLGLLPAKAASPQNSLDNTCGDTALQVFTAALIAEDLATTFYASGLLGPVIQNVAFTQNAGNLDYIKAALAEEIQHADLLRSLLGISASTGDPYQTFYFQSVDFAQLGPFLNKLEILETAFIGAYLAAIQELAEMAADSKAGLATQLDSNGNPIPSTTLEYYAKVAGSILGIESEHRALGRVIGNVNPANEFCYEQNGGITCVYNGTTSAVVALTPFLTTGPGKVGYSLQASLSAATSLSLPCKGTIPPISR